MPGAASCQPDLQAPLHALPEALARGQVLGDAQVPLPRPDLLRNAAPLQQQLPRAVEQEAVHGSVPYALGVADTPQLQAQRPPVLSVRLEKLLVALRADARVPRSDVASGRWGAGCSCHAPSAGVRGAGLLLIAAAVMCLGVGWICPGGWSWVWHCAAIAASLMSNAATVGCRCLLQLVDRSCFKAYGGVEW